MDLRLIIINTLAKEIAAGLVIPGYTQERLDQLKDALEYISNLFVQPPNTEDGG